MFDLMKKILILALMCLLSCGVQSQRKRPDKVVPVSLIHTNILFNETQGIQYILLDSIPIYEAEIPPRYSLQQMQGTITGTRFGLFLDFGDEMFNGKLVFGFIPHGDSQHPHPVYFRSSADIKQGRVAINISQVLRGRYDMIGWEQSGQGTIGYRIINEEGRMLYDGKVSFKGTGPFEVAPTLVEGPLVNLLQPDGATISMDLNMETAVTIEAGGDTFTSAAAKHHEIAITGLDPDTDYEYTVKYGEMAQTYSLHTAPAPGTRGAFSFAYASDSRSGNGGGERDLYGANFYIMKKIMALAKYRNTRFMQFTGDLINGYLTSRGDMELQYANWKRAVEPFQHYIPVYAGMGNHEAFMRLFQGQGTLYQIDRYPYETESAEAIFASQFVNPLNGPDSEDGASYDPNSQVQDFPTYQENVFYYTYDNVAVINLNSDYWYSPSSATIPKIGGGLHGYIMDNQVKWLEKTLKDLEKDDNIDHIFITEHTPFFPNGGHVQDDMWYNGDNSKRPYVAGKPLKKGIIERRDELLDLIVNESTKVIGILTGDEHNYCRTEIGPETQIYKEDWDGDRLELSRTIYQINNGAAGAPYYAQEQTPWTPFTSSFTTQNALVFFHVDGEKISLEVRNPDTLELVDEKELR